MHDLTRDKTWTTARTDDSRRNLHTASPF